MHAITPELPPIGLLPKYYVFKREEFDELNLPDLEANEIKSLPDHEFFVLRKQDMFAVHALWAYVGVLRVGYDLIKDDEDAGKILELADQIATMATHWQIDNENTKIPD